MFMFLHFIVLFFIFPPVSLVFVDAFGFSILDAQAFKFAPIFELLVSSHLFAETEFFISAFARALRPYPISGKRIVPAHIVIPDWADDVSYPSSSYLDALNFI